MRRLWLFLLAGSLAFAEFDKVGTTSASFLKLGVGSRATAMGGAFVALSDDGLAPFWNPAGMMAMSDMTIAFSHNEWALDIDHQFASVIIATDRNGRLGLSVTALTMGEQEVTTVTQPDGTGLYYDVTDLALGVSYARQISDRFRFGMTGKYIQLSAFNENASTLAFDLGCLLLTDLKGLTIGAALSNFGGDIQYAGRDLIDKVYLDEDLNDQYAADADLRTEPWPLPLMIRIGVSMDLIGPGTAWIQSPHSRLTVAFDGDHPNDGPEHLQFGAEYSVREMLYVRGGYRFNYDEEALTMGLGLRLNLGGLGETRLDYAVKPLGPFGTTSVLGIEFRR